MIREASLELQEKSLHAVRLTLHFRDSSAPLVVTENEGKPELLEDPRNVAAASYLQPVTVERVRDDAADRVEVETWQRLRTAGADSAWLSTVIRRREQIDVAIYATDPETRHRVLGVFQASPAQSSNVTDKEVGPMRPMSGPGPALSEEWLERQMPDVVRQNEFKSEISRMSREVLGKALWLERLSERRRALRTCECAKGLDGLIDVEERELLAMEGKLAVSLSPYTHASASPHRLRGPDAFQLDLALQHLFLSSELPRSKVIVEDATVRRLLNVN